MVSEDWSSQTLFEKTKLVRGDNEAFFERASCIEWIWNYFADINQNAIKFISIIICSFASNSLVAGVDKAELSVWKHQVASQNP